MGQYDEILNMPHPESKTRNRMSMSERAAQFAPFAALVGFESAVSETARITEEKIELDEYEIERIDRFLFKANEYPNTQNAVITYFKPDGYKSGGSYVTVNGTVRRVDENCGIVYMSDGSTISISNIVDVTEL